VDAIWGILYVSGMAVPALLTAASFVVVYKLARRFRSREPRGPRAAKMLGLHGGVVISVAILGGFFGLPFIELVALALVPLYQLRGLKRTALASPGTPLPDHTPAPSAGRDDEGVRSVQGVTARARGEMRPETARRTGWFIGVSGVLLPWVVGLVVKLYLQAQGKPTLSIRGFIDPSSIVVLLILTTVMWSSPFVILGFLVGTRFPPRGSTVYSFRYDRRLGWWTYGAGVAAAVLVFIPLFNQFDSMLLLIPIGFFLILPMAMTFWVVARLAKS
jgi:hypothetical protein